MCRYSRSFTAGEDANALPACFSFSLTLFYPVNFQVHFCQIFSFFYEKSQPVNLKPSTDINFGQLLRIYD